MTFTGSGKGGFEAFQDPRVLSPTKTLTRPLKLPSFVAPTPGLGRAAESRGSLRNLVTLYSV